MSLDIKICGLSTPETVDAALRGGATHVGFIFFPKSPRNVSTEGAGRLRQAALGRAKAVAVTVDAADMELDAIVEAMQPDMLQLHGRETPERVAAVKARYRLPVMKALSVATADDLTRITPYRGLADRFLLDARQPANSDLPGGNGVCFDWNILVGLDPELRVVLSGGVNATNVADALRIAAPAGIDISSGVERSPGVKDPALIADFFRASRAAAPDLSQRRSA